jgi:rRNA maturation RNase YbeY
MKKILFFNHDRTPSLKNKGQLRAYIMNLVLKEHKNIIYINYIFCSDNQIIKINRTFLNHNYYTDVISFNLARQQGEIEAEIYISIDRVRENARKERVSYKEELHRVIFHGVLHLCGYKDKKREEIVKMRKAENMHLKQYFKQCNFI